MMTLLAWLPNGFMVLGIALIGLGLMVGLITGRRAASLLGFIFLLMVSGPFIDALLDTLFDLAPWWLLLPLGTLLIFALLGALSRMLIGRGGGPHGGHAGRGCGALWIQDGIRFGRTALPSFVWRAEKMSPTTRLVNGAEVGRAFK